MFIFLNFLINFTGFRNIPLPSYPWNRKLISDNVKYPKQLENVLQRSLLDFRVGETAWTTRLDRSRYNFLRDHIVGANAVMPAAGFVEMALEAASMQDSGEGNVTIALHDVLILAPLQIDARDASSGFRSPVTVDIRIQSEADQTKKLLLSNDDTLHCTAFIEPNANLFSSDAFELIENLELVKFPFPNLNSNDSLI